MSRVLLLALLSVVVACAKQDAGSSAERARGAPSVISTPADTDDFGAPLPTDTLIGARVVSLVPAATEIIFAMGRGDRLVGRTTWDLFPDSASLVANMGDGIQPNVEVVLAAKPTLVVLYATMANKAATDAFIKAGIPVMSTRVDRIADFERVTRQLGVVLNATARAQQVVDSVSATLAKVRAAVADVKRPTVVWPMYDAPVMVVGQGSFVAELLDIAGATNTFAELTKPSPEVTMEEIVKRNPDFVMTSPVAAMRFATSAQWKAVRAVRERNVLLVDTLLTGRPTVTLGMAAVSLAKLLHPERAARLP
ncbi:MAG: ABC transporter substrate-binding protein [Phycisphaerae bacterium]|nr:ABC transporter substrate-binding protein [Gemmatimonadaceae bacterium]